MTRLNTPGFLYRDRKEVRGVLISAIDVDVRQWRESGLC